MSRKSAVRNKAKQDASKSASVAKIAGRPKGLWQAGNSAVASVIGQMEQSLGEDLSGVQVHSDPQAAEIASSLTAEAFTLGDRIFLGSSAPPLGSTAGRQLLAHELTHVVQQRRASSVDPAAMGEVGDSFELSADRTANLALRGETAHVPAGGTVPGVQRQPEGEKKKKKESPYADRAEVEAAIQKFLEKKGPRTKSGDVDVQKISHQLVNLANAPPLPPRRDQRGENAAKLRDLFNDKLVPRKPGPLAAKIAKILPSPYPRAWLKTLHPLQKEHEPTMLETLEDKLKKGPDRNAPPEIEAPERPGPGDPSKKGQYVESKEATAPTTLPIPVSGIANAIEGINKKEEKFVPSEEEEEDTEAAGGKEVAETPAAKEDTKVDIITGAGPAVAQPAPAEEKSEQGLGALPTFVESAIRRAQADGKSTANLVLGNSLKGQAEVVFKQVEHLLMQHKLAKGTVTAVNVFFGGKLAKTVRLGAKK